MSAILCWVVAASILVELLQEIPYFSGTPAGFIISSILVLIAIRFIWKAVDKIIKFISPESTVKTLAGCLLKTMKQLELIESMNSEVAMRKCAGGYSHCMIIHASAHDSERFGKAIAEMLSAIDNPRYVLVKKHSFLPSLSYTHSYACPSIIGTKKERAQVLAKNLKKHVGNFELFFTRNFEGVKHLTKCRRKAYLNRNEILIKRLKRVN
jgi:hypothetical protein